MANDTRFRLIESGVRDLLTGSEVRQSIASRIDAIRQACESESSWDGYESDVSVSGDRVVGRIWSVSSNLPGSHERHQRMIRNLDAGS